MTLEQVKLAFTVLDLRERLIAKLGVLAGMKVLRRGVLLVTWLKLSNGFAVATWIRRKQRSPNASLHFLAVFSRI